MFPTILYEDPQIVVVDKPRGLVCNRAITVKEETLQDMMDKRYGIAQIIAKSEDERYFVERVGLVHRLDRATSGVLVLAKQPQAFVELLRQFKEREVEKTYEALTHGLWSAKEGEIALSIGRRRDRRERMGVREDGRESRTKYQVLREWKSLDFPKELGVDARGYGGFSLVEFLPRTGRTHQIRVHSKAMGHPVVADEFYGGRKRYKQDIKFAGGLMLLAKALSITHPTSGKRLIFTSKIDLLGPVMARVRIV